MTAIPDFLYWYRARCLHVVDGDTYELNDPDPAKRALAVEGKAFVASRIEGKDVILNTFKDRGDKYGRWLAVVCYLTDEGAWFNLNDELLEAGLALPMKA